jgi:Putative ABC-transporter type IV
LRGDRTGMRRFLAYGLSGFGIEIAFTAAGRALRLRDRRLVGHTYLWMLPIYGGGGLLLERLHARSLRPAARALVSTLAIYAVEYGSGALLARLLGACPWRYRRGLTLGGLVRLDYAPFWYGAALLFEILQGEIAKLDRPRRGMDRRIATGTRAGEQRRATRRAHDRQAFRGAGLAAAPVRG